MSSRHWQSTIGVLVLLILSFACFHGVLFGGGQFGFRDAAHHYYPLHRRVQQEWQAGRVPLWDPWENGGVPLLGNPTAAVFYPGKVLFAVLPFDWASRVYVIAHVLFSYVGMIGLLRAWKRGPTACALGALSYAFGGPVLLLYCNVIYLVGAAWLPFGMWAVSAWLRTKKPRALAGLALVLALTVLGGDPETAYLIALVGLAQAAWPKRGLIVRLKRSRRGWLVGLGLVLALTGLGFLCVWMIPGYQGLWTQWPGGLAAERVLRVILVVALFLAWLRHVWRVDQNAARGALGVLAAGVLALVAAAVQVLPTAEFVTVSTRSAAGAGLDRYGFSLVPYRLVEAVWPSVLGLPYPTNRSWRNMLPPRDDPTFWVGSLYMGAAALVLGAGAIVALRKRVRMRLALLLLVALLGSFGLYAAPLGLSRWLPAARSVLPLPRLPAGMFSSLIDFRSGDGGPYWMLASILPGFDLFRYPSKLLPWAALGLASLAAFGWDDRVRNRRRVYPALAFALAIVSVLAFETLSLLLAIINREAFLRGLMARGRPSPTTGPFDFMAYFELHKSLGLGAIVYASLGAVLWLAPRRPKLAGSLAIGLLGLDLTFAQAPWIWTVPQSTFETPPRALQAIEAAEAADPSSGPYRIHRPAIWEPLAWFRDSDPRRLEQMILWERDTLQPLHGLPYDQQYTFTLGILEPEAHLRQFRPWLRPAGPLAETLGVPADEPVLYYPRKVFDLWNTRYFVLPVDGLNWRDENRGYASMLANIEVVTPNLEELKRAGRMIQWRQDEDWQILRNKTAFPRAWVVHQARLVPPLDRLDARDQETRLRAFQYQPGPLWTDPDRPVVDPRRTAWVESDEPRSLRLGLVEPSESAQENVRVAHYDPQRVVLDVDLASTGLVVLADAHAPGWHARIDDRPAPILRVNLGMRGIVVPSGKHTIVYNYEPLSFRAGAALSACGLAMLVVVFVWGRPRRGEPVVSSATRQLA